MNAGWSRAVVGQERVLGSLLLPILISKRQVRTGNGLLPSPTLSQSAPAGARKLRMPVEALVLELMLVLQKSEPGDSECRLSS